MGLRYTLLFFTFLVTTFLIVQAQKDNKADSLKKLVTTSKEDTNKVVVYNLLAAELWRSQAKEAGEYAQKALVLSQKLAYPTGQASAYNYLGLSIRNQDVQKAVHYFQQALEISEKLKDKKLLAMSYNSMGIAYLDQAIYGKSLDYFFKALAYNEDLKDLKAQATQLNNIGLIYKTLKKHQDALANFQKAIALNEKTNSQALLAGNYNNIGTTYRDMNKLDSCLFYFQKAYDLNKKADNMASQALNLGNLADVYLELGDIKEAQKKLKEAQEINTKIQNKTNLQRNLVLLAKSYRLEKRYADAEKCMKEAQTINQTLKNKQQEIILFRDFAKLYQESGEYKKAIEFWEKYVNLRDSAFSKENAEQSARMQTLYETEKKEKENELLRKEQQISNAQIQRQFVVGIAILVVLVSVSILAVVLLRNNREKQRINQILTKQAQDLQQANQQITSQNEELHQQQEEIIAQRDFIEEQNKEIQYQYTQTQSSIKTALTIQEALLPFENRVGKILKDYFVLFKPRDIVSGDFYWIEKVGEETLVVAGDCTGHGVPGAFMSLIAINLLERIVLQQKETSPAQILRDLHNLVRVALKQDENDNQNGMDLAVVKLTSHYQLHFAGAKRPLYYIDSAYPHEVKTLAGSRKSIGGIQNETKDFEEIVLTLRPESVFYVSSDGLEDQNNQKRQRLQKEPILEILLENFEKPLIEQQINLEKLLETHMIGTTQRDDILFLGIRV